MLPACRNVFRLLLGAVLLTGCAGFPHYTHKSAELHRVNPDSPLVQWRTRLSAEHNGDNGVLLLGDGQDAFLARLALIMNAADSLDLQYYLYHDDLTGTAMAGALLAAADRGVRVRLLLDDMSTRSIDDYLRVLSQHPNVHIRLFNPFRRDYPRDMQFITRYGVSTHRMHNKSMIADAALAIVGGRNIGDEYFDAAHNAVVFGDLDVLTTGPVVDDIASEFDRYWNSSLSVPVENLVEQADDDQGAALRAIRDQLTVWLTERYQDPYGQALRQRAERLKADMTPQFFWGNAYVVADDPGKVRGQRYLSPVMGNVAGLIGQAQQQVLLISPYFVPGERGVDFLTGLVKRGVRVVVLTNSLASTDVPAVHSAYKQYRAALVAGGVELYELKSHGRLFRQNKSWLGSSSASLHAKALLVDDRYFYVGSMNFDPRSVQQNTEMGVLFDQPELGQEVSALLMQVIPVEACRVGLSDGILNWDCAGQRFERDPEAGIWRRMQSWFLGLLPLESEL